MQILAVVAAALLIFAALSSISVALPKAFGEGWTLAFRVYAFSAVAALVAAVLLALYFWGLKNLPCPACKGRLDAVSESKLEPPANAQHHYQCTKCKTMWNSGISSQAW